MDLKLKGHNVLVTGGTKGIGRAIVEILSDEGCNIALCARNADDVNAAVEAISAKGVKVVGQQLTLAMAMLQSVDRGSRRRARRARRLCFQRQRIKRPGDAGWQSHFDYNIMSAVRGVEACMPFFEKSENPSVVMISTTAALEHFINAGPYNAMKLAC